MKREQPVAAPFSDSLVKEDFVQVSVPLGLSGAALGAEFDTCLNRLAAIAAEFLLRDRLAALGTEFPAGQSRAAMRAGSHHGLFEFLWGDIVHRSRLFSRILDHRLRLGHGVF